MNRLACMTYGGPSVLRRPNLVLRSRRWMYEAWNCRSELVEASPSGNCWESVKRMAFLGVDLRSLERVDFGHFSNVTVLKISGHGMSKKVVINLSGLIHLKSLEVIGYDSFKLVIQGLPRNLTYLSFISFVPWKFAPSEQFVNEIACLEELQFLNMRFRGPWKIPDMRSMVSLRVAYLSECWNAVTVTGLSSKLTNLRVLDLKACVRLRRCPGVGDLVALEELNCRDCKRLERLPSLRKLRHLRILDIYGCHLITELPGLGDLVALEELHAGVRWAWCRARLRLPDMSKLRNLQELRLDDRRLEAVPGVDSLISLRIVEADFRKVLDRPNLQQLTNLQELRIRGWNSAELREVEDLAMLHTLDVQDCRGMDDLPDFHGLISLQKLVLGECEFKAVRSLSKLSTLVEIKIWQCRQLEMLPDLRGLTRLISFEIKDYDMARALNFTLGRGEESSCEIRDCSLPVRELPDLNNFPRLESLTLWRCGSLMGFTCSEPLPALRELDFFNCSGVKALPDLGMFPALRWLNVVGCSGLLTLSSSGPLTALKMLRVRRCRSLSEDDLHRLRALCPSQCAISVEEVEKYREWMRVLQRFKGCFRG